MTSNATQLVQTTRSLLAKGGVLQSTVAGERIDNTALKTALQDYLRAVDFGPYRPPPSALVIAAAAAEVLANAQAALDKTAGGQSASGLSDLELSSLQGIVLVTGRPALRYLNTRVQIPPTQLGDNEHWHVFIVTARSKINRASASVGRVALNYSGVTDEHIGTAWRVGEDLVVTNRHVAKRMVECGDVSPASWRVDAARSPLVDFAATDGTPEPQRAAVVEIVFCSEEETTDVAILRLDTHATELPPALDLDWAVEGIGRELASASGEEPVFQGEPVYIVGHPNHRRRSEAVSHAFGEADGRKRCSPGFVTAVDLREPLLEHDCSTLGGNSGSCVLTVAGHAVVGVHVGACGTDDASGLARANVAIALSRLGAGRLVDVLRHGRA